MYITLGLLVVTGIALGVLGDFWRAGWFWASLLVLVAITAAMVPLGAIAFSNIRRFAGTEYAVKGKRFPAEPPDEAKMMAAIGAVRPDLLTIIGLPRPCPLDDDLQTILARQTGERASQLAAKVETALA
jgi:hypothetical protein